MIINGTWIALGAGAWIIYKLACWVDARHAHTLGTGSAGADVGIAHDPVPAGSRRAPDRENGSE